SSGGYILTEFENQDIVCISSIDWDPIWTRKQQVMSRLPKSNKILYVEPPITLLSPFKDPATWSKWGAWFKGIRRLNENIYLYSPPVVLPFGNKYRLINRFNQWWISLCLKRSISKINIKSPVIWTYMPNSGDLVDKLGDRKLLVYDCVDEHSEYTGFINKETMTLMEQQLMQKCDLVFVTAKGLYESKKNYAKEIYFSPNAANVELFMKAQDPKTQVPQEAASITKPIVGFVGVIQDWIDLDLVKKAALTYKGYSFVMVGPVAAGVDVSELKALPNVYFLGRKDVKELPSYIKAFDVCINPFKLNELTDKVSPLKFYEYLASGKPIVSVDMPGVSNFSDVVEVAADAEEFVRLIDVAIKTESADKLASRLARARENSWESRVEFMLSKMIKKMK
ncbi:MAG TPA: glycosyltransferase, partial [Desulfobacteria bacterium]|nr:glycosyltransferase [Desulfobacteria bacterium]